MRPVTYLNTFRYLTFLVLAFLLTSLALAQDMIGVVSALSGNASIIRNSEEIPAESGTPIFQDDVINSADNSRVQILLKDQTAINLGANASLTIDAFVYSDEAENVAVKVSKGAFKFISGKVATKNPEKVIVKTPVANIGVRGTEFVGVINPQDSRIALLDGKIEDAN
ncbi:MAG: FecR domain-containing protein, partial [Betaproteobacteria bacterium]|nr:FecR domain-containing protein [Betaproteobacteria bacterium]